MDLDKDIEKIRHHVNDLHVSVAEIRVEMRWIKWFIGLIIGALLFAPLIARFWQALGI